MLNNIKQIFKESKKFGWILEPDAKRILTAYNIKTPEYIFSKNFDEILNFAQKHYPVVCKIVSPNIMHKSEFKGVIVGINDKVKLKEAFDKLSKLKGFKGILVEKMVKGIELIIGAKNDTQFGPVILVGMGGVSVEIYKDTAIRMAPLREYEIDEMISSLKCYPLLKGYRGEEGIDLIKLKDLLLKFSKLLIEIEPYFDSVDLNPVICSQSECLVADARIILLNQ